MSVLSKDIMNLLTSTLQRHRRRIGPPRDLLSLLHAFGSTGNPACALASYRHFNGNQQKSHQAIPPPPHLPGLASSINGLLDFIVVASPRNPFAACPIQKYPGTYPRFFIASHTQWWIIF